MLDPDKLTLQGNASPQPWANKGWADSWRIDVWGRPLTGAEGSYQSYEGNDGVKPCEDKEHSRLPCWVIIDLLPPAQGRRAR